MPHLPPHPACSYGDIIPFTTYEQLVAMLCMLAGCLFISFIISTLVQLLAQAGQAAKRASVFREKMRVRGSWLQGSGRRSG